MSRIVIHDPRRCGDDCALALSGEAHELVLCKDREALLEAMSDRRPDAIVYVLSDLNSDRGVLSMLRRIAPKLPMILLGGPADLEARRSVQDMQPTYYGVFPLEPSELRDAVCGALDRRR